MVGNVDNKTRNAKVDQITLWIPHRLNSKNIEDVIETVDSIFHFSNIFKHTEIYKKGLMGYTGRLVYNNCVTILWNFKRVDMGILVIINASGKFKYEQLAPSHGIEIDWVKIIKDVVKLGGHLTRIDIAADFVNYVFSADSIYKNLLAKKYFFQNRAKRKIKLDRIKAISGNGIVQTIYVGSRPSDAFLRIYDKRNEQIKRKGPFLALAENCNSWTRFEAEIKGDLSHEIGLKISNLTDDNDLLPFLVNFFAIQWQLLTEKNHLANEWLELKNIVISKQIDINLKANEGFRLMKKIDWFISGGAINVIYFVYAIYGKKGLDTF